MQKDSAFPSDPFIWLEAVDARRNIARRYMITQSNDLFGHMIVEYRWGRIGARGQGRAVSFAQPEEAKRFIAKLLRRRSSSRKRIGVAYRLLGQGHCAAI